MVTRVTAIVSVHNGEMFLRGRLDNLLEQTLYTQKRLQIVVINSGSTDTTARILEEYVDEIDLITTFREPLYTAWNRAIDFSTAEYCVNANVDDRHRIDALEVMADYLDTHPEIALCYGDSYLTDTPNATWAEFNPVFPAAYPDGRLNFPEFSPIELTRQCVTGNSPMWRRTVAVFDGSYMVAGDYEFSLRLAAMGKQIARIPEILGLFYWHENQLGRAQSEQSRFESQRAVLRWSGEIMKRYGEPHHVK